MLLLIFCTIQKNTAALISTSGNEAILIVLYSFPQNTFPSLLIQSSAGHVYAVIFLVNLVRLTKGTRGLVPGNKIRWYFCRCLKNL